MASTIRLLLAVPALLAVRSACAASEASARPPEASGQPLRAAIAVAKPAAPALAFRAIAAAEAAKAGVPYALIDAVMKIESGYHPDAVGGVGEIGLMQIRPATAAMLGFRGTAANLADPATNIHYGAAYLGQAWKLAGGDVCKTLMKYRAGHGETVMTPLSVTYCQRARVHLASIASPLAGTVTPADLVAATAAVEAARASESLTSHGRPKTGAAFWTAFRARIARANARVEARWKRAGVKRMASR